MNLIYFGKFQLNKFTQRNDFLVSVIGRQNLVTIVKLMFLVLAIAFLIILFKGAFVGTRIISKASSTDLESQINNIKEGNTVILRLDQQRVWVTRFSQQQLNFNQNLSSSVISHKDGCFVSSSFCIVKTETKRQGVEIRYSLDRPAQVAENVEWNGGFVNPGNGAVYDLLGRAYVFQGDVPLLIVKSQDSLSLSPE